MLLQVAISHASNGRERTVVLGGTNAYIGQLRSAATRMCSTMSLDKVDHKTKNNENAHYVTNLTTIFD